VFIGQYQDTSIIVSITANATAAERTENITVTYRDFDNNDLIVDIPITQQA